MSCLHTEPKSSTRKRCVFEYFIGRLVFREWYQRDDISREILKNEIVRRKNLLIRAIETQNAAILPRLIEPLKSKKCPFCPFNDICFNVDGETQEAAAMATEKIYWIFQGWLTTNLLSKMIDD